MSDSVRIAGLVVVGMVLVLALTTGAIYLLSETRLNQSVAVPPESMTAPTDIASVQRGQHLASAVAACTSCHGPTLTGRVLSDDRTIGRFVAPNLTRGRNGLGATRTDGELARAIRHGLDPSGRPLLLMPSNDYHAFSDADVAAIVAYVRSLPAVDSNLPSTELRLVGRALFVTGQLALVPALNIDHSAPRPPTPAPGPNVEYGRYLVEVAGCASCHGPGLSGGPLPLASPGTIPAGNITPAGLRTWSEADFFRAMRTGLTPDGQRLDSNMPWPSFAQLSDDELRAIWSYLQGVAPRPTGNR
jgi:mono/diheme cytochrome c family protein